MGLDSLQERFERVKSLAAVLDRLAAFLEVLEHLVEQIEPGVVADDAKALCVQLSLILPWRSSPAEAVLPVAVAVCHHKDIHFATHPHAVSRGNPLHATMYLVADTRL